MQDRTVALERLFGAFPASKARAAAASLAMTLAAGLAGCGSLPDATISYYQTKTEVRVKVTRSVLCDKNNHIFVADSGTPTLTNSADTSLLRNISLAKLRGTFSDSDMKFEFYDDGRLKGINASQTGEGESIIKGAVTLAPILLSLSFTDGKGHDNKPECDFINGVVGQGKALVMTFEGPLDLSVRGKQDISADEASTPYAKRIAAAVSPVCAAAFDAIKGFVPVKYTPADGDVIVETRQPALVPVIIGTPTKKGECQETTFSGQVVVAQLGTPVTVPIPRPVAFGKASLALSFSDAGAVTTVEFANNSGAAGLLGAANSIGAALQPESTASKAADLKAQADLIAQQQRLLQCKADPANCK